MDIEITIKAHMEDYDIGSGLENQQAVIDGAVRERFAGTALHIKEVSMKEDVPEKPSVEKSPVRSTTAPKTARASREKS
jgi:hypothetical protein